jgi:hypothetical protein
MRRLLASGGAEIAEAALVLPVIFIFLLGVIWFGRAFNIYSTITQAAQQGALVAARPACATCANPSSVWAGNPTFPGDTIVFNTISAVMQASNIDPSQMVTNSGPPSGPCVTTNNVTICREVWLNPPPPPTSPQACTLPPTQFQVCGTTVSFQYPFQFYLPFTSLNLARVVLSAQAQSRMEN